MRRLMWWIPILLIQDVHGQADRIRAAMAASLEQQQISVQQQVKAAARKGPAVSWPNAFSARPDYPCSPVAESELGTMITAAAAEQKVDAALVREVARQESGFYPCVV